MGDNVLPTQLSSAERATIAPWVFVPAAALVVALVGAAALAPDLVNLVFGAAKNWIVHRLGWLFKLTTAGLPLLLLGLAASRYGHIRLGHDGDEPEFARLSWFSMLFSAGMGIGLMFFSVAEPLLHFENPPLGVARTEGAARRALGITFFHWGIHAWGVYVLMGLALAYFTYRKNLPCSVRSVLHPLLGNRIHGRVGDLVDLIAVFGTVFGLATSLGLGAKQIGAGVSYLFGVQNDLRSQIVIIVSVTAAATLSLISGVQRGIRRLSELNLVLAFALWICVLTFGPTQHVLTKLPRDLVLYAQQIAGGFGVGPSAPEEWQASWTVFYWAWWIAWAPFVGVFVARISKGRTIREFVLGVLLAPTLVTIAWLLVFGETAMFMERVGGTGLAQAVREDSSVAIYKMLENLPMQGLLCGLAMVAVAVFFVTSSDSGSFVVDMLTSGGHPNPPIRQRVFWALTEGAVAIALLVAGGLHALQSAAIATGLPFCLVLILSVVSLWKALAQESASAPRAP